MKLFGKILVSTLAIVTSIISAVVFIALLLFIIALVSMYFSEAPTFHGVTKEVFPGCFVEHIDSDFQSIYYYPTGDKKDGKVYIVEEWAEVIKFASDKKENLAFHCIYTNEKDVFVVYNISKQKEIQFKSQQEFLEYCDEKNLKLSEWESGGCKEYEIKELGNGWRLYEAEYPDEDKILDGYGVVYEGYVEDVRLKDNGITEFVFAVPDGMEKEIPTSNKNLNVSEAVIGSYKFAPFGKTDVCYYEKLSLDTKTGEISVLEDDL